MRKILSVIALIIILTGTVFAEKVIASKESFGDEMRLVDYDSYYTYEYCTNSYELIVKSDSELALTKLYIRGINVVSDLKTVIFVEESAHEGRLVYTYLLFETEAKKIQALYSYYKESGASGFENFVKVTLPDNWRDLLLPEDSEYENTLYWHSYYRKYIESSGYGIYSFKDYMSKWWDITIADNWEDLFVKYGIWEAKEE